MHPGGGGRGRGGSRGRTYSNWTCPKCGVVNFKFRTECYNRNCGRKLVGGQVPYQGGSSIANHGSRGSGASVGQFTNSYPALTGAHFSGNVVGKLILSIKFS